MSVPHGESATGMLIIDKPAGMTSHDVVLAVRRRLNLKAGHTGTLDPQATGVLLVCVGSATRLARFLQHQDKVYECTVRLGWETDTYDADGAALADPVEPPELDPARLAEVLGGFCGEIDQVPPDYSAKKIRGQPSYKRVRRGEEVSHEPVRVKIRSIELLSHERDELRLRVSCGPGTYVRTLAVDLGRALGCPAHLSHLRRLAVGSFEIGAALGWESLLADEAQDVLSALVPPADMLPDWPLVVASRQGLDVVRNGGVIEPRHIMMRQAGAGGRVITGGGEAVWVRVVDEAGVLLTAAETRPGGILQPRVVLK